MLRKYFGDQKRVDQGVLLKAFETIDDFHDKLYKLYRQKPGAKLERLELLASGFKDSLNELEQSIYSAQQLMAGMDSTFVEELNAEKQDDYRLHVYFYKNALIRVFSTLDKLGHFIDDLLELQTGQTKERFSYFTVLRQMYRYKLHVELEQDLFALKKKYQQPMQKLRKRRNMEIHSVNVEMLDDLAADRKAFADKVYIEDLSHNMEMLRDGFELVLYSVFITFKYADNQLEKKLDGRA